MSVYGEDEGVIEEGMAREGVVEESEGESEGMMEGWWQSVKMRVIGGAGPIIPPIAPSSHTPLRSFPPSNAIHPIPILFLRRAISFCQRKLY